ncbi:protein dachsous-like [Hemicordylus capensis]|uniref:protein dachsous-like n=1 Tax=Hemicordylus capensis TaxID=884348 RepID=UPI002303AB47|nr:protein dachsous-like [Hemicordylus capensis]
MAGRKLCYRKRILLCFVLVIVWESASGQLRYVIPEEMEKGSFVGDIAKDLNLNIKELSSGDVQIISRGMKQYFVLDLRNGHLFINEVIDREQICHQMERCLLNFEIFVKDKMKFFTTQVEIADINDNSPSFPVEELEFKILENTGLGAHFLLPDAQDPDLGTNSLQSYHLSSNKHFSLDIQTGVDGVRYAEMVLKELLDHEEEKRHQLILTAADGGEPVRSGTVQIYVAVADANDNAPVFSTSLYEVNIVENILKGSQVLTLNATDLDEEINSKVSYSFRKFSEKASKIFHLDSATGQISVIGNIDFEDSKLYEMEVQAQDVAGLSTRARVVIRIMDANDNSPEITITPLLSKVVESSPPGSVIALININDRDDGENGEVTCSIPANLPFLLKKSFDSYYSLEIASVLDREKVLHYNITITASDQGSPPLSATAYFPLEILDENDNPPTFKTTSFIFYIEENNKKGDLITILKAHDHDRGENGRIIYSIIEKNIMQISPRQVYSGATEYNETFSQVSLHKLVVTDSFLSSCLSINSETGVVYALSTFDYEECHEIQFQVKAQDGGSPPLSSNVSVTLFILDQNDNGPEILYPSPPTDGSTGVELAPRSSEPGYLVTKVVAVDADSGQNAWLSYQLIKATEPGLFTVGLHTGEIRTARFFLEKDALKQSLVVLVKDNGQPPLSASVTVTVVLADSIPESLSDVSSISAPIDDPQSDLTFYLVIAVAFVSCLFFTFLLVLLALRLYRLKNSHLFDSGSVQFSGVPVSQFVGIDGVRAFLHSYCHEGSLTTCSQKSQFFFPIGSCTDTLTPQQAPDKLVTLEESSTEKEKQNSLQVKISDVNDNAPVFNRTQYMYYLTENNPRGASVCSMKASDPDSMENATVTFSITERGINDFIISSYLSINSETGVVYALHSFDYEEFQEINFQVKAQDGGSPPLSSNVSVTLFILDQNDNAPEILYPSPPMDGSTGVELAPCSSEPGYLVTKVVAVDVDSGQNAWLSYQLIKATEPGLFTVGLHTGEIRTARFFLEKDALKQSLVVLVKDNGQPPLSASVTVTVVLADSIPEILTDLSSALVLPDPQSDLTFYLVIAVAFVSCLFFIFLLVLLAIRLHKWRNSQLCDSASVNFSGVPVSQFVGIDGVRAFLQSYCQEVSLTSGSQKSQILFPIGSCTNTLTTQQASTKPDQFLIIGDSNAPQEEAAVHEAVAGQINYAIPEEMQKGSFVGNIAKDLGIDGKHFSDHGLRIVTRTGTIQHFALNFNSGNLQISERIDREEICGMAESCILTFQVIIESKLEIYRVEVKITDINDNAPKFSLEKQKLKIGEASAPGSRFPLPEAQDPDLGINSVQSYQLTGSSHFSLDVQKEENGARHAELVLEKSLDREEQLGYDLILTATDGGDPIRSATSQIQVIVLDANDNAPVFTQQAYEVSVKENIPKGSSVVSITATDLDEGLNGEIKYSFKKITEKDSTIFLLNSTTGAIILMGNLDYEESPLYEFQVKAEDGGGLSDWSKVVIIVMDLNDNAPELAITFSINTIHENSPTGTVIALLNVQDQDSGLNGEVTCSIPSILPFQLKKSVENFYSLVTRNNLDREQVAVYNITITATDHGTPPLSVSAFISLQILDTNDNPPLFVESAYMSYVLENNLRGASIFSVKAKDPDWEENSRLSYSIIEDQMTESLLSSYLSINSETGVIYALHSFDYEEFQEIRFQVRAQDGGSPPLSSNVSVTLFIQDQNDNAPEILYPSPPTDGSTGVELAPRSSETSYLVTKVVAVDADSAQNAWLSYQLIKATEPGLFTVGLHTGEIRTARFFLEKDAFKQSLVVLVKDNGQPPLSTSVTVTVVLADSIPELLTDLSSISTLPDPQPNLTFYLVIAVAFVSCLFFIFLLVLLVIKLHNWRNSQLYGSASVNFGGVPVSQFVGIDGVRAFLQSYCQEVSLTSGSRKSQIFPPIGSCTNTLTLQQASDKPDPLLIIGDSNTVQEEAAVHETYVESG